jgi:hypothetical protein
MESSLEHPAMEQPPVSIGPEPIKLNHRYEQPAAYEIVKRLPEGSEVVHHADRTGDQRLVKRSGELVGITTESKWVGNVYPITVLRIGPEPAAPPTPAEKHEGFCRAPIGDPCTCEPDWAAQMEKPTPARSEREEAEAFADLFWEKLVMAEPMLPQFVDALLAYSSRRANGVEAGKVAEWAEIDKLVDRWENTGLHHHEGITLRRLIRNMRAASEAARAGRGMG